MCVVHKAQMLTSRQKVAIKVLKPDLATSETQCKRFLREAKVCMTLRHPSIVQVLSTSELDGLPALVMEFVEGETLREKLKGGLDLVSGLEMMRSVVDALYFAHCKGVIHRDLKPGNILITNDGEVKVADWGLARLSDSGTALTKTGMLLGTPAYMAPEQITGKEITPQTDLYALGVMLFELATSRLPFNADNATDLLTSHLNAKVPSIKEFLHTAPPPLVAITRKLMSKEPDERPQNADEIGPVIDEIITMLRSGNSQDILETAAGANALSRKVVDDQSAKMANAPSVQRSNGPADRAHSDNAANDRASNGNAANHSQRNIALFLPLVLLVLLVILVIYTLSANWGKLGLPNWGIQSAPSQKGQNGENCRAIFREVAQSKCDELTLRYSGPALGVCRVHLVDGVYGTEIGTGSYTLDLANSEAITASTRRVKLALPVAIVRKAVVAVTGSCQPYEATIDPTDAITELLRPLDELEPKKLQSLLRSLFKMRNELQEKWSEMRKGKFGWESEYSELQFSYNQKAEKIITSELGAKFVMDLSQALPKLIKAKPLSGSQLTKRFEKLMYFDNAVCERRNIQLPWGFALELFDYEFGQIKVQNLLNTPPGSKETKDWHKAFEIDFQERVGKYRRWLWMAPERFVLAGRKSAVEAVIVAPMRDEGMLQEKGATFKDELTSDPNNQFWVVKRDVDIKPGNNWPPDEARLEFVTRLFAKDFFVKVHIGSKCQPITVINTSTIKSKFGIHSSSSALYVSIPIDTSVLEKGRVTLEIRVEGPPYDVKIVNPMVFHCMRLLVK